MFHVIQTEVRVKVNTTGKTISEVSLVQMESVSGFFQNYKVNVMNIVIINYLL